MKCVYIISLFAFVALQVSQAAPVPEEVKKVEATPEVAVEAVAPVVAAAAEVPKAVSEPAASAAPAAVSEPVPSATEVAVLVEEKKA